MDINILSNLEMNNLSDCEINNISDHEMNNFNDNFSKCVITDINKNNEPSSCAINKIPSDIVLLNNIFKYMSDSEYNNVIISGIIDMERVLGALSNWHRDSHINNNSIVFSYKNYDRATNFYKYTFNVLNDIEKNMFVDVITCYYKNLYMSEALCKV